MAATTERCRVTETTVAELSLILSAILTALTTNSSFDRIEFARDFYAQLRQVNPKGVWGSKLYASLVAYVPRPDE